MLYSVGNLGKSEPRIHTDSTRIKGYNSLDEPQLLNELKATEIKVGLLTCILHKLPFSVILEESFW